MRISFLSIVVVIALSMPLAADAENKKFTNLCSDFMYESLARRPNLASCAGYHKHMDKKAKIITNLDSELDNFSLEQMVEHYKFFSDWRKRFASDIDLAALDKEERADWNLIENQIAQNLLEYGSIKTYTRDPVTIGMLLASAVIQPLRAPNFKMEEKQDNVISRLKQVPRAIRQVKQYLQVSSPFLIDSALVQNENVIGSIQQVLPRYFYSSSDKIPAFERAADDAVAAMQDFSKWLKSQRSSAAQNVPEDAWRLGKDLYEKKFALTLQCSATSAQVLEEAEAKLKKVRAEMLVLAEPMYTKMFGPPEKKTGENAVERENRIVGAVLERISLEHPERDHVLKTIQDDLEEVKAFVVKKNLVNLTARKNLRVVPASDFYNWHTFAGLNSAPPLEPQATADFWVMPISAQMPDERAESLLREYNNYALKWLVIHEALPGHYVQSEHLNDLLPTHRRLLRATFRNEAYVEGWAEYIAQVMMDAGFMRDEPKYKMVMHKIRLRLLVNTILDIKMHTTKMSDREALDLMIKSAFQNEAEAQNKLKRVKLSSCSLPSYYVGMREWQKLRAKQEVSKGAKFDLLDFHNRALDEGPLPVPVVEGLLN